MWIDHVGYCKRTKSPFADWSKHNCNRQNKKSAPKYVLKVVITTQKKKSALLVKRHFHTCHNYINKEASTSLRHTLTCSLRNKFQSCSWRRERERGAFLGEDFMYLFELSLGIVLAIYNKEVFLGFLPHEGFLG